MPESQFLRYVEATYAALSMLNVAFFIGVLVKTPFHYALWKPVLMIHQQAYSFCVFGMFCLIIDRLLVTIWPQAFSDQTCRIISMYIVGSAIVVSASTACTYYLQYAETFGVIVLAHSILELITLMLAIICIFASKYKYRVTLAKTTLNSRYRVDEVIELTWVLFPLFLLNFMANILTSGSALAFLRVDVTTFNFQKVLSMVCTTSGFVQPWYLLLKQRFLSRRLYSLFHVEPKRTEQVEIRMNSNAVTDRYFSMLQRSWSNI
ncbi:hypothetical protein PRIPAC_95179 [Pristionchus pacificus]|uniref:Uncharacterized protein n=1 Tax=Pristionchus pacificus TaxID=54126 RepID=A0A2A6BJ27_PRIPA|nr:hypothetical protein PRIPAC_95179 [Pristionchus pacificus]|eukprot:PDM65838.1 hypothetical protein PRIPAC_45239 [Pristionchus pacificus]